MLEKGVRFSGTTGSALRGERGAVAMEFHAVALSFMLVLRISSLASGNKLQPHM